MDNSPLCGLNGQIAVMSAHGYALGRNSYVPECIIEWITQWIRDCWGELERNTKLVIVRDTVMHLQDSPCDFGAVLWKAFAEWAYERLDEIGKSWVVSAVAYKNKPWPLGTCEEPIGAKLDRPKSHVAADQVREMGLEVGDTIVGREVFHSSWTETMLTLLYVGKQLCVWDVSKRHSDEKEFKYMGESASWTLNLRDWYLVGRAGQKEWVSENMESLDVISSAEGGQ